LGTFCRVQECEYYGDNNIIINSTPPMSCMPDMTPTSLAAPRTGKINKMALVKPIVRFT